MLRIHFRNHDYLSASGGSTRVYTAASEDISANANAGPSTGITAEAEESDGRKRVACSLPDAPHGGGGKVLTAMLGDEGHSSALSGVAASARMFSAHSDAELKSIGFSLEKSVTVPQTGSSGASAAFAPFPSWTVGTTSALSAGSSSAVSRVSSDASSGVVDAVSPTAPVTSIVDVISSGTAGGITSPATSTAPATSILPAATGALLPAVDVSGIAPAATDTDMDGGTTPPVGPSSVGAETPAGPSTSSLVTLAAAATSDPAAGTPNVESFSAFVAAAAAGDPAAAAPAAAALAATPNKIAIENAKQGNPQSEWGITGDGDGNIQGFATEISTNIGQTVDFK